MSILVMKFGGSSLASLDHIQRVAEIVSKRRTSVNKIVVVVSAMGKTTDVLIDNAKHLNKNASRREMDVLMATGEQMSMAYLALALAQLGESVKSLSGAQAGIKTYGPHSKSRLNLVDKKRILSEFETNNILVVAGFQGINDAEDITTLGRGGSDTSAVALACVLESNVEIYTDVEGIYTIDPRLYPKAKKLDHLSYFETMEMANLGASIIEPRSVELASKFGVKIHILLNSATKSGTLIQGEHAMLEENVITNVSVLNDVVLVYLEQGPQNVSNLFIELAKAGVSVDVISQTYLNDISFTVLKDDYDTVESVLDRLDKPVYRIKDEVSKVSIIGNGMRNQSGVAARVFEVFASENVPFYQVSTSEISISYIVDKVRVSSLVHGLAKEFNL